MLLQAQPQPSPFAPQVPEHPWQGWPGPGFLLLGVALLAATLGVLLGVTLLRTLVRRGFPRERAILLWPLLAAAAGAGLWAAGIFWGVSAFFAVAFLLGPWPFVNEEGR